MVCHGFPRAVLSIEWEEKFVALRACVVASCGLIVLGSAASAQTRPPSPRDSVVSIRYNVMVAMRDGVRLATDIYQPAALGRYPVILVRDPYDNGSAAQVGNAPEEGRFWASHGYVYLHQDTRGRHDSDGAWYPFANESADGHDAIEWAGTQPWSNGKVGMLGASYLAYDQWQAASMGSDLLRAIIPVFSPLNLYHDVHPGSAFELTRIVWSALMNGRTLQSSPQGFAYDWDGALPHLPLISLDSVLGRHIPLWRDWIRHPSYDPYWQALDMAARLESIKAPALSIGGWYDTFLSSTLAAFTGMRARGATALARGGQKLVIGPWKHGSPGTKTGDLEFGPDARVDLAPLQLRWMDYWLKGIDNGVMAEPPVRIFVMGANRWRTAGEWPIAGTRYVKYYFHSAGRAAGLDGDGTLSITPPRDESPDRFVYDPARPVPTRGGGLPGASPGIQPGPFDQTDLERRPDVLVYTTPPLEADLEITGPLSVSLYAGTDATDTDFTAKLVDVHQDGRAYNLNDGIVRARYRESMTAPGIVVPGQVYEYRIDLVATSNLFERGHRIRVEISSSNFPRFDRNPNTGNPFGMDAETRTATQTVHHAGSLASHIVLPVIPTR